VDDRFERVTFKRLEREAWERECRDMLEPGVGRSGSSEFSLPPEPATWAGIESDTVLLSLHLVAERLRGGSGSEDSDPGPEGPYKLGGLRILEDRLLTRSQRVDIVCPSYRGGEHHGR